MPVCLKSPSSANAYAGAKEGLGFLERPYKDLVNSDSLLGMA